jgi:hypothetical protein
MENAKLKEQIESFERRYKNIDVDSLHEKIALQATKLD